MACPALAATIGTLDADIEIVGPVALAHAFAHLAPRSADTEHRTRTTCSPRLLD